ncbi:hypothetical protein GW17_00049130 [Ensete ventricosum]|nr:hypothetical protein GW17_00049130 [Ensete ventricosum]
MGFVGKKWELFVVHVKCVRLNGVNPKYHVGCLYHVTWATNLQNHLFVRSPPSPPLPRSATDELEALRLIVMAATATLGFVNLLLKPNGNRSSGRKPFPNSQPPCLTRLPSALRPHLPSPALPLLSNAPSIPTAAAAAAAVAVSLPLFFHPQVSSLLLRLFLYPLIAVEVMAFLGWKDALAVDGEFGILEGRTIALVHPVVMGGLFVYTLWAGYLGWQWRRVRTIQNEINDLKQAAPAAPMTVAARSDAEASPPASPSPAEAKIQQLTEFVSTNATHSSQYPDHLSNGFMYLREIRIGAVWQIIDLIECVKYAPAVNGFTVSKLTPTP